MYLFNKREVFNGWSHKDFCSVRDALDVAGIDYRYKVEDSIGHSGSLGTTMNGRRMGSMGINMDYSKKYIIYVKKQYFEQAQYALSQMRRNR